jgi:hypothetical protein
MERAEKGFQGGLIGGYLSEYRCLFIHGVYRIISYDRVMSQHNREDGNVLFLILIAIVLFAALSYAVSQSTRGGGIDPSDEKAELLAAEILNYVTAMQTAITRLQVSHGCEDTEISFENPVVSGYINTNAPSDKSCHVFDPAGAGMSWREPPEDVWRFSGAASVNGIGKYKGSCPGYSDPASCADLLMRFMIASSGKKLCSHLNKMINLKDNQEPPVSSAWTNEASKFTGSYTGTHHIAIVPLLNKMMGCYRRHATSDEYVFYAVLIPR